jgi:hypothetical protein
VKPSPWIRRWCIGLCWAAPVILDPALVILIPVLVIAAPGLIILIPVLTIAAAGLALAGTRDRQSAFATRHPLP